MERDLKIKGWYQEYHRELFWDLLCFCCILMTLTQTFAHLSAFADDCILYWFIETSEDHKHLQCDLNSLIQWIIQWQMKLSPEKCITLRCTRSPTPCYTVYSIDKQPLQVVDQYTYLGVKLSYTVPWHTCMVSSYPGNSK